MAASPLKIIRHRTNCMGQSSGALSDASSFPLTLCFSLLTTSALMYPDFLEG